MSIAWSYLTPIQRAQILHFHPELEQNCREALGNYPEKGETGICQQCGNEFQLEWPFYFKKGNGNISEAGE